MDEWVRFGGITVWGALDWATVVLFVCIAMVYFLAPVLGYQPEKRSCLTISLYILVAYAGLSVTFLFLQYMELLDEKAEAGILKSSGKDLGAIHIAFWFAILKMILFSLAMLMFVLGLQSMGSPKGPDPDEE
jgi:hypothetical protein